MLRSFVEQPLPRSRPRDHEYTPGLTRSIPGAVPAWRFLTETPCRPGFADR